MDTSLRLEVPQDLQMMNKEKSNMTERILSLVLEILYLLIEEDYVIVKESGGHVKYSSTTQRPSVEPQSQRSNSKKILEVTNKITELLTEEWEYLEEDDDLEKELDDVEGRSKKQPRLQVSLASSSESTVFQQASVPVYIRKDRGIITVSPHNSSVKVVQSSSKPTIVTATASPTEGFKLPEIYIHIPTDQIDDEPTPNNFTTYVPDNFSSSDSCKSEAHGSEMSTSGVRGKLRQVEYMAVKIKEEPADWDEEHIGEVQEQGEEEMEHLHPRSESDPASYTESITGSNHVTGLFTPTHIKQEHSSYERQLTNSDIASLSRYSQLQDPCTSENFTSTDGIPNVQYVSSHIKEEPEDGEPFENDVAMDAANKGLSPASSFLGAHIEEVSYKYYLAHSSNAQPEMDNPEKPFSCSECGKCFKYSNLLMHHAKSHQKKPLICCECGKQYSCKTEFEIHRRIHTGEKPFVCSECGKGFRRKSHMLRHRRIHGDKQLFPCPECAKCFHRLDVLNQHRKIHKINPTICDMESLHISNIDNSPSNDHEEIPIQNPSTDYDENVAFACPDCSKCFHSLYVLEQHRKIHQANTSTSDVEDTDNTNPMETNGEEESQIPSITYEESSGFACSECGKCYEEMSHLERHQRVHMGEKPFSCTECGKSFRFEALLELHWGSHIATISCPECGKSFASQSLLNYHLRVHAGSNECICSECGKEFPSRSQLVDHYRTHTGEKPYMCPDCGKYFRRKAHVVRHRKIHTGNKPYSCHECGKCFESQEFLSRHTKIHRRKRPHSCSQCGKSYTKKSHLSRHQRTHAKELPYTCSECGESFQYPALLNHHLKLHTGQNDYSCPVCDKSFGSQLALARHQKTHSKEKSFVCMECGKSFTFYSHFMRHQATHTGEKPYECQECGKRFTRDAHLVRHKRTHSSGRASQV